MSSSLSGKGVFRVAVEVENRNFFPGECVVDDSELIRVESGVTTQLPGFDSGHILRRIAA
jgi:hypothetical protein